MNKMWQNVSEGVWKPWHCNFFLLFTDSFRSNLSDMEEKKKKSKGAEAKLTFMMWYFAGNTLNTCHDAKNLDKIEVKAFPAYLLVCMRRMWYNVPAASSCGVDSTASHWSPSAPATQPRPVLRWRPAAGRHSWSAPICWGCRLSSQPLTSCLLGELEEKQQSFKKVERTRKKLTFYTPSFRLYISRAKVKRNCLTFWQNFLAES